MADQAIRAGSASTALVIGADKLSAVTDWTDRRTCILVADGAGAHAVVAPKDHAVGLNATVAKVASGAAETVPMHDHWAIIDEVKRLTGEVMCERVIEAVGKQWPLDLATALIGFGGRLVIAGYHQDGPRQVNMQDWNWKGIDVVNAHERDPAVQRRGVEEAIDAVASGRIDLAALLTHRYPLSQLSDAILATRDKPHGFVKALVIYE